MMRRSSTTLLLMLPSLLYACGVNAGNPKKPDGATDEEAKVRDRTLELISIQVDETTRIVSDMLDFVIPHEKTPPAQAEDSPAVTFGCTKADDGSVASTLDESGSLQRTIDRRGKKLSVKMAVLRSVKSVVQGGGDAINCDTDRTAKISWDALTSYHGETSFEASMSRQVTPEGDATSEISMRSEGERKVDAKLIDRDQTDTVTFEQTVVQTARHERAGTGQRGPFSISTSVRTASDAPLHIKTTLNATNGTWVTHEVLAGNLTSFENDAPTIDTKFQGLVFSADAGCLPVAGKMEGTLLMDAQPRVFSVDFDGEAPRIIFNDGSVQAISADVCDLETRRHRPGPNGP